MYHIIVLDDEGAISQEGIPGDRLERVLEQVKKKNGKQKKYIILPYKGSEIVLEESEIVYIEREKRITKIHMEDQVAESTMKMTDVKNYLNPELFVRCHNSFIINLEKVSVFNRTDFIMRNQEQVPVSRSHQTEVKEAFTRWAEKCRTAER